MGNKVWRILTCSSAEEPDNRDFYIKNVINPRDNTYVQYQYPNNIVTSSRYTWYNFLPKCLFEQFQRIANFYFILIMTVQLLIDSPVSPYTTVIPIVFVISISVIKQGIEDIMRHRSDNEVNNRPISVLSNITNKFESIESYKIKVGDIIKCYSNNSFPCDMVLLASCESNCECAVTTANLDGETSLKIFTSLEETQIIDYETTNTPYIKVSCTQPIEDLYTFNGKLEIESSNQKLNSYPLSSKNLLLRGAIIKNTEFIIGVATYTGSDTKLSLNSKGKVTKYSQVELKLNQFLVIYFIMLFSMSLICVILAFVYLFYIKDLSEAWYVPTIKVTPWEITQVIFSFIILYNYLVPISLYVTIELVKFVGAFLFRYDIEMYDPVSDNRARVNTSDLNEELGQISYLFSDKTGTLTENDMQFRQCSIGGIQYIDVDGELCKMDVDDIGMDELLLKPFNDKVTEFLIFMSLCHTVRVERGNKINSDDGTHLGPLLADKNLISEDGMEYDYQASSPDEKAFLEASRRYGIIYHGLINGFHCLTIHNGAVLKYKVREVFEFDSDRKCMTVIIDYPDGTTRLLCKGAESSMLPKGIKSDKSVSNDIIMDHLTKYAENGLRTLVFGYRLLSKAETDQLFNEVQSAKKSLHDSEKLLAQCYEKYEKDLFLIGCTGIEDRLQDGVKETLIDLRMAGIKIWVLTGDKEETAVNISYSAGHFYMGMHEIRLTKLKSAAETNRALDTALERLETASTIEPGAAYCLIVDGQTLNNLMEPALEENFVQLCQQVGTVLCCRMTPLQKAEIVRMIKQQLQNNSAKVGGGITAAIGDGGNDVSMIQEAHVGLGIYGKEGRQAVRASDYAFAKFRYLRKALLVHGHLYYSRITNLIQYFFYKNIVFIFPQFYYSFVSLHSQQTMYNSYVLALYNVTFTTLPIMIYGVLEQSISRKELITKPILYKINNNNSVLKMKNFLIWNLFGLWHSVVLFLFLYGVSINNYSIPDDDGKSNDIQMFGMQIFFCVWFIVSVKLGFITYYYNYVVLFSILFVLIGNILLFIIFNIMDQSVTFYLLCWRIWSQPSFWLQILVTCLFAFTPDLLYKIYRDRKIRKLMDIKPVKHMKPKRRVSYVPTRLQSMTSTPRNNIDDDDNDDDNVRQNNVKRIKRNNKRTNNSDITKLNNLNHNTAYNNPTFENA